VATAGERAERTYYIAADTVIWDYAPDRHNRITGKPFGETEKVFVAQGKGRIGPAYQKCIYRGYTDKTFTAAKPRPSSEAHLGILGPVIRAEVGDTIKVVFRNNCSFPTSIHPHGVFYEKDSEGAPYSDGTEGSDTHDDEVPPNATYTYTWQVPERAGPGPMDGGSAMWMYHSHADEVADVYAGLSGFLVVTADGRANPDGSPEDVDREIFSLYEVVDENSSPFLDANIQMFALGKGDKDDEGFVESNLMHAINGYVYGNGPTPTMRKGERVRWYLMGMGTEVDLHTPHWHGSTVTTHGMRTDVVNLLPASMAVADMRPDATGTWMFHCHVGDHIAAGMQSLYRVTP
jgi:FtsP/CotA-like multicopper oxidase with cupredoxin domain